MPKERQTCTECSMRRQKCDRQIPCGRCIKRGDADKCTREWPKEGYDPKVHRIYPRPEKTTTHYESNESTSPSNHSTVTRTASDPTVHPLLRNPASNTTGQPFHPHDNTRRSSSVITATGIPTGTGAPQDNDVNPNSEFDVLGWGRAKLKDYSINKSVSLMKDSKPQDMEWEWDYSNGFGGTGAAQIQFLQLILPSRKQVFQLVDYHLSSILWYHVSFHGPTFYKELTEAYNGPRGLQIEDTDLRWSAVLFAVMAASMICAGDKQASSWGFPKAEKAKLTRSWFKATLCCLNLSDYMWRHHIFSVQAIEVLTMSAHILGFSNTQSTLLGAALKIAQGLGLQRMSTEDEHPYDPNMNTEAREKIIRRETARRMWTQLCIQDWFSIPFCEMYTIQRKQFSTPNPSYINDETLEPLSSEDASIVSFNRCLVDLARVFSECFDAITEADTLLTKYDEVIKFETKIMEKQSQLPTAMDNKKPLNPSWPIWIQWARRSLTVCYAHKIIMVHRHFLGRSFTDTRFARTRESCVAAAKTILEETKTAYEGEGPMLWIDQAFVVAAGITLSLDLFHRKDNDPLYQQHHRHVEAAIAALKRFENSMIAVRGIRLLSQLLTEQARLAAAQKIENYSRIHMKRGRSETENPANTNASPIVADHQDKRPRQKFDVGGFVQSLGTNEWSENLRNAGLPRTPGMPSFFGATPMLNGQTPGINGPQMMPGYFGNNMTTTGIGSGFTPGPVNPPPQQQAPNYDLIANNSLPRGVSDQFQQFQNLDLGFEAFEQLFPPQTGISNSFLFEDLLNFDL